MADERKPWAYLCHKDDRWRATTVKEFAEYYGSVGWTVTPVYSREEYEDALVKYELDA